MNSGKGIPRRALEILTCLYNCGLSGRQTVAPYLPPIPTAEQGEERILEILFFYVNFSKAIQDRFFKERDKQGLFFPLLRPSSDVLYLHAII